MYASLYRGRSCVRGKLAALVACWCCRRASTQPEAQISERKSEIRELLQFKSFNLKLPSPSRAPTLLDDQAPPLDVDIESQLTSAIGVLSRATVSARGP